MTDNQSAYRNNYRTENSNKLKLKDKFKMITMFFVDC